VTATTESEQQLGGAPDRLGTRGAESATRSGLLLGAAAAVGIVTNYAFLLASGRLLGSSDYGSLAALLGLLTVVLFPASAFQLAVSREVSRRLAGPEGGDADAFSHAIVRLAALVTVPVVVLALALSIPLAHLLHIEPAGLVTLALVSLVTALLFPVALGVLQGHQRFHALAALTVIPFVARLLLLGVAAWVGYRLGGAVFATVVAAVGSTALALGLIRDPIRHGRTLARPPLKPFVRYLVPVVVGLVGIAVLTNIDVLIVKVRFSGHEAGAYAAASAFARVAFFMPATILAVLFPRTAARQARGEETRDILGRSLLVTAAFCGLLALFYLPTGRGLIVTSFGEQFAQGGSLLAPYAIAIGLYSLAYVLAGYHLSRNETRYAWIVAIAVVVQIVVLSIPSTLKDVVWANLEVAAALVVAHEVFVESSIPALRAGMRHFTRVIDARVRSVALEGGVVLLGMTAFVCVLFWPIVTGFNSTVLGRGSDAVGTVWWLWSLPHEGGYHLFGSMHHTLTGAPFGWDGQNGLNIQWLVAYYPAYLATMLFGAVAAQNLVLLSGYVLSGATMYLLVRYLGCRRLVATWAGMVYIVFPWHLARTPHSSLVHLEFIPLLLLAMVAAAQRPTWSRLAVVGLIAIVCWLTSGYFGTMAIVGAVAFALGVGLSKARRRIRFLVLGVAGSVLLGSALVGVLSEISGVGRGSGLHRVASDLTVYGLRPLELVIPPTGNLVVGRWLHSFWAAHQHGSNPTETTNYIGFLTIGLAVTWLVYAWRRRDTLDTRLRLATPGLAVVLVVSLLLALPSPVTVFGVHVWMPSRLLWAVVTPFRVPSRWVVVAMAALVPLGALALQEGTNRLSQRGRQWHGIRLAPVALVAAAMVLSFIELGINPNTSRLSTRDVPPEYTALKRTRPGILAEYPLVQNNDYVFWQIVHHRRVLDNEAFGTPADDARRALVDPRTPGTAQQLALLGVTAMITHPTALNYAPKDNPRVPNASWGPGYQLVARTPDGTSVWRVVAQPAPALVTPGDGLSGPVRLPGGVVGFPLTSPSGVGYIGLRALRPQVIRLSFDAQPPKGKQQVLRVADASTEGKVPLAGLTHVSVLVQVPRGDSLLLLKTDPAATSAADAIVLSAMHADRSSGQPQLHAILQDPDPGF